MPDFQPDTPEAHDSIRVYFANEQDRQAFFARIGVPPRTKGMWYPHRPLTFQSARDHHTTGLPANTYPIYIISKGRPDKRLTADALDRLSIPYHIVIEPQEHDAYAAHIPAARILTLPFQNLGQGSIPARNYVWDHAHNTGARRHWILDDNIAAFIRLNGNRRTTIRNENPFIPAETFADRYDNVALAGMQYRQFAPIRAPYKLNTRIYSCILIDNALPFRWRGRYNEDTDLSLRALKAGYCTVLFHAYRIDKTTTMRMEGGNTDDLYYDEGRQAMAEALREQHPDVVTITEKWGRPQHHVDYTPFRHNKLVRARDTTAA
jgi:hypothetical protein